MPYTTVATNDVLTASHFNTNYRDQVVSTVTSGTRPSGTEGQIIYETDTDKYLAYISATWVEIMSLGATSTWTPQIDQGATTNIAKTVVTAKFVRYGNVVEAWCQMSVTGTGTATNNVTVTLPVATTQAANDSIGHGEISDAGTAANTKTGDWWVATSTTIYMQAATVSGAGRWGFDPNTALASSDSIRFHVRYLV